MTDTNVLQGAGQRAPQLARSADHSKRADRAGDLEALPARTCAEAAKHGLATRSEQCPAVVARPKQEVARPRPADAAIDHLEGHYGAHDRKARAPS
jgi:hypothetical protein